MTSHFEQTVLGHLPAEFKYHSQRPSLLSRLLSNAFSDFGSVGRKKKKKKKKYNWKIVCWKEAPAVLWDVSQRNIRGAWLQSQHGGNGGRKNRLRC